MGKFTGGIKIALVVTVGVLVPGAALVIGAIGWWTYSGLQGARDEPLVRFARMLSNNDGQVVEMAKALVKDRAHALASDTFADAVFEDMQPEDVSDTEALVSFTQGVFDKRRHMERFVILDWKAGGTEVTDRFDAMLLSAGAAKPTAEQRDAILAETAQHYEKYGSMPILMARYHPFFEAAGLRLLNVNLNWDAYVLVAVANKTARCWQDVELPPGMRGEKQNSEHMELAIEQAAAYIRDHMPALRPLVTDRRAQKFPASACLPAGTILRAIFGFDDRKQTATSGKTSGTDHQVAVAVPDMPALIERADRWLRANRPGFYAGLKPGVSDAELDAYEARFGLKLPAELRLLWKWKNGSPDDPLTKDGSSDALLYNHRFISLAESAETKAELDGMIGADFESPEWWKRAWVPFTTSWGGDHYVVKVTGGKSGVIDFWHDDATRNILAASFNEWFEQLVITMERGELEIS